MVASLSLDDADKIASVFGALFGFAGVVFAALGLKHQQRPPAERSAGDRRRRRARRVQLFGASAAFLWCGLYLAGATDRLVSGRSADRVTVGLMTLAAAVVVAQTVRWSRAPDAA
ncbi:hypothetical protein [Dactylosporangium sp. CA-233914]|uniref:hypothetical protein n=1 Tax=Dactylosporangium sp. CA-233914 TaxID=3239934 RepID=UPI003D8B0294